MSSSLSDRMTTTSRSSLDMSVRRVDSIFHQWPLLTDDFSRTNNLFSMSTGWLLYQLIFCSEIPSHFQLPSPLVWCLWLHVPPLYPEPTGLEPSLVLRLCHPRGQCFLPRGPHQLWWGARPCQPGFAPLPNAELCCCQTLECLGPLPPASHNQQTTSATPRHKFISDGVQSIIQRLPESSNLHRSIFPGVLKWCAQTLVTQRKRNVKALPLKVNIQQWLRCLPRRRDVEACARSARPAERPPSPPSPTSSRNSSDPRAPPGSKVCNLKHDATKLQETVPQSGENDLSLWSQVWNCLNKGQKQKWVWHVPW